MTSYYTGTGDVTRSKPTSMWKSKTPYSHASIDFISFRKCYGYKIKSTDENTNRPENTIPSLIKSAILTCSSLCGIFIYYLEIKSNLTGQKLLKVGEKQIISSCTNKCFTQQKLCKTKQTSYNYGHVL